MSAGGEHTAAGAAGRGRPAGGACCRGADVILTARRFVLYGEVRVKYTGVHESALTARVNWQADAQEEPPLLPPARGLDLAAGLPGRPGGRHRLGSCGGRGGGAGHEAEGGVGGGVGGGGAGRQAGWELDAGCVRVGAGLSPQGSQVGFICTMISAALVSMLLSLSHSSDEAQCRPQAHVALHSNVLRNVSLGNRYIKIHQGFP